MTIEITLHRSLQSATPLALG